MSQRSHVSRIDLGECSLNVIVIVKVYVLFWSGHVSWIALFGRKQSSARVMRCDEALSYSSLIILCSEFDCKRKLWMLLISGHMSIFSHASNIPSCRVAEYQISQNIKYPKISNIPECQISHNIKYPLFVNKI